MVWRAGCLSQDCMCKSNSIVDVTQPFVFVPKCLPTYLSLEHADEAYMLKMHSTPVTGACGQEYGYTREYPGSLTLGINFRKV
jgi:hypothetical protein